MRVKKNCGSCGYFLKLKHMQDNSGLCEYHDARTNTDKGHKCKYWIGIKYYRQRKQTTQQILNEHKT